MNQAQQTGTTTGMALHIRCEQFSDLRAWLQECLPAGILRCLSPERKTLCDAPATSIYWQDAAEWYPCCDAHAVTQEPWCGSTPFTPHDVELVVITGPAQDWLCTLPIEWRKKIRVEYYVRDEG